MKLFGSTPKRESSGVFVPNGKGFTELPIGDLSTEALAQHLGYNTDQLYFYLPNKFDPNYDVQEVSFEIFSKNIVFVKTKKTVLDLRNHKVNFFLRHFDLSQETFGHHIDTILQMGVDNGSLPAAFLGRVLGIENVDANGVYFSDKIGYYLFFNEGVLTSFDTADGLNSWAKDWKANNPDLLEKYEKEAGFYWSNDRSSIINEINQQAEAWSETKNSFNNKFADLHRTDFGTVNYVMLGVSHYNKPITLDQFQVINHGRYQELTGSGIEAVRRFQVGKFTYDFLSDGILTKVSQV